MVKPDELIHREMADVAKIVLAEALFEGNRRGHYVSPHDPVVQMNAATIIIDGAGVQLRRKHEKPNRYRRAAG
jgi:hypothetical protein